MARHHVHIDHPANSEIRASFAPKAGKQEAAIAPPYRQPRIHRGTIATGSHDRVGEKHVSLYYATNFFGRDTALRLFETGGLWRPGKNLPETISKTDFWMMCLDNINRNNDEGHGCTCRPLPKSSWGMIFSAVNHMETVGQGLYRFVELLPILSSGLTASLGHSAGQVHLTYSLDDRITDFERGERYIDLIALVFHCALLWGTARCLPPASVRLSGRLNEKDGSMAAGLSPNRSRDGTGITIVYKRQDMDIPLGVRRYRRWASHETSTFLEIADKFYCESNAKHASVIDALSKMLSNGNLSQQQAAHAMGMSVATLQRRLADAGTSFRLISREVRKQKLRSLLATDSHLDDIAVELGFSERRSLWRACHDWFGMSPTRFRDAQRCRNTDVSA